MDVLSAAAIGTALAADAMAASFSRGMRHYKSRAKEALLTALFFGSFQMLMPVLGWSIGRVGSGAISGADHIIAFVILMFLGLKMLLDARAGRTADPGQGGIRELFFMAVATSIDALASGVTLPASVGADTPIAMLSAVLIIGIITFTLSFAGFCSGGTFRSFRPQYAEAAGGIVLIAIALKTLICG